MKASAQQYAQAWWEALQEADASEHQSISERMIAELHHAGELRQLNDIVRRFEEIEHAAYGRTAVTVRSAHELNDEQVREQLSALFGDADIVVTYEQDPKLIGGMQIVTGDSRWDYSVRGQLRSLEKNLNDH